MTQSTDAETTLVDVVNTLDPLTQEVERFKPTLLDVANKLASLTSFVNDANEKFNRDHQAIQWLVQLAFSLIATATTTIIISSVLRR